MQRDCVQRREEMDVPRREEAMMVAVRNHQGKCGSGREEGWERDMTYRQVTAWMA
jgi:hypothetical protein